MLTRYRAFNGEIEEFEIIEETPMMITLPHPTYKGRVMRERKESDSIFWADTWGKAHKWLLKKAFERLNNAEQQYKNAVDHLSKVKEMQPPTE